MTSLLLQSLLALVVGCFALYVLLEARSVRKCGRAKKGGPALVGVDSVAGPVSDELLPPVSVLLPVYNEKLVVERLVNAVCALQYPPEKLDILVLDDSNDETHAIAARAIALHRERGIPIRHARREKRIGYKAGNLNFGLTLAKGDFVAIFDADCLPPPDFLLKAMPCFADEQVGFLQTGMDYANKNTSFLTRFQAMEAGHKENVTTGLSRDGFMASLTGSSCVWRRTCIEAIGGISADTITEDVDMGYRAQLHTWKYVFLRDVVSLAELPESMGAFRVQRQRWARGLMHNALRHVRGMFAAPMGLAPRLHAISLMFSSFLLAAFYLLLLISLPMAFMLKNFGALFHLNCTVFIIAAVAWAWCNTVGGQGAGDAPGELGGAACGHAFERRPEKACGRTSWAEEAGGLAPVAGAASGGTSGAARASLWKQAGCACGYVLMFFPLSLYYFSAAVQVFAGIRDGFHRTPKGCGRRQVAHPPVNALLIYLEIFSLAYALAAFAFSIAERNYWVALFSGLAGGGFAMTLFFSWRDKAQAAEKALRHVLITGASGALGGALALEYAAPGMHLTLHGRREAELAALAARCEAKGASVTVKILDLRRRRELRRWIAQLCRVHPPDLVIANAGRNTSIGPQGQGEDFAEVEALVEVNLLSTMALADGVLPAMRERGSGQIAIISSLAAYYGLPSTPAYCAAKSALRVYGEALRGRLAREGIRVNVALPGYVDSPMCAAMPGPKPFMWTPERAARAIKRGLKRDWARISFPFPLNLGVWGLSLLPPCLAMPIARLFGYGR